MDQSSDEMDFNLGQLYQAARQGDLDAVENIANASTGSSGAPAKKITPQAWAQSVISQRAGAKEDRKTSPVLAILCVLLGVILLLAVGLFALNRFYPDMLPDPLRFFPPVVVTEPATTPAAVLVVTATPTFGPSPTPVTVVEEVCPVQPSPTPKPSVVGTLSAFKVFPSFSLYPALPALADKTWVIEENQALLQPPYSPDNGVWNADISADKNAAKQPYLYTNLGAATVGYTVDTPLPDDGIYQVLVLDTVKNSNITQHFDVLLDGQPVPPYRGTGNVFFTDDQKQDRWQSLGFYQANAGQNMQVTAAIPALQEEQAYAADRVAVVKLADEMVSILDNLPGQQPLASLVDDASVKTEIAVGGTNLSPFSKFLVDVRDALAWNLGYKTNQSPPQSNVQVTWPAGTLPAGEYKLLVWVPEKHATAAVEYKLLADGKEILTNRVATLNQSDFAGEWVEVGIWGLEQLSNVDVLLIAPRDTVGEVGVDAVALVRVAGEK